MPFKWQCYQCSPESYRFSVIAGTIFENTNKPLRQWFKVVHLMLASKKGMSALQIMSMMGFGSYGTAHSMCHKIRAALIAPEEKLGGIVEVDETWVGGKDANRHWDKKHHGKTGGAGSGKTAVIGAVSRKGNVVARFLGRLTRKMRTPSLKRLFRTRSACSRLTHGADMPARQKVPATWRSRSFSRAIRCRRDPHEHD